MEETKNLYQVGVQTKALIEGHLKEARKMVYNLCHAADERAHYSTNKSLQEIYKRLMECTAFLGEIPNGTLGDCLVS